MKPAMETKRRWGCGHPEQAQKGLPGQSGFSLIEMMIAILVLSVGILAVCSMQVSGMKGNASSYQYTQYSTLAMDYMETLISTPYDSLPADTDGNGDAGFFTANTDADQVVTDPDGGYTIYTNVAADYLIEDTTSVSVIIVWRSGLLRRSVSLQGVIPRIV